jgi:bifunctional non-homologous end joining protein LigD
VPARKPEDKLEPYRAKRKAAETPEPFGGKSEGLSGLFVVHKHAARALHFDLRLELDGVLVSWAVPKGPSLDPADKRLAVHVEDHPLEYGDFEGTIPKDNYGAGSVIVWDRGQWVPLEDPHEGMKKGKLLFELKGYKLRGVFTLVKTKRSPRDWLLIKKPDAFSGKGKELPQESVLSGLTVEERKEPSAHSDAVAAEIAKLEPRKHRVRVSEVELMLAEPHEKPPDGGDWLFEIKYDGYRILAAREDGSPVLRFRAGGDASATFPEITRAMAALPYESLILDGEVAVLDEEGRPSFQRLQRRGRLTKRPEIERAVLDLPAVYFAFDLLAFDGLDLRSLPLDARKAALAKVLPSVGAIRYADHVEGNGQAFFEAARNLGLEGVVAKRRSATYRGGRGPDWQKIRVDRVGDFAVIGYSKPQGGRVGIGALHLALLDDGAWRYSGRVGTGFTDKQLTNTRKTLDAVVRAKPIAVGAVPKGADNVWTEPVLVAEVRYKERTDDGLLRQPAFLRFRDDKKPEECEDQEATVRESAVEKASGKKEPEERAVRFTNLDKVFWPEEKYTKGDLIEYYRRISPWILHYLRDRPVVMTRYPDGIKGKSFFQKDAPGYAPSWLRRERMWSEHGERELDYFVCDDEPSLLYVINLGTIPLHIWSSRIETLAQPDWCILDFDPKGAPFSDVVKLALAARDLCDEIGLPCYPKTSGSTGLHVLIPLGRQFTFAQSKQLGEVLARVIESDFPKIATTARALNDRGGKVYVDFLQNGHGKLIVSPFCVRPVPGAMVSTPLEWSEVNARLDPKKLTIETVPRSCCAPYTR